MYGLRRPQRVLGVVGDRADCRLNDDRRDHAGKRDQTQAYPNRGLAEYGLDALGQHDHVQAGPHGIDAQPVDRQGQQLAERQVARRPANVYHRLADGGSGRVERGLERYFRR